MMARKVFLIAILLLSLPPVFAQAESSFITIKIKEGKYLVSGVVWSEDVKNEILTKLTRSLGLNVESRLTASDYVLKFDDGWEKEFDKTLRGFSKFPTGMLSFSSTPRVMDRRISDDIMTAEISLMEGRQTPITFNDLKGDRVVVFLIESWCGPCIGQAQYLDDLYPYLKENGIEIIGLSTESSPEAKSDFRDFVHRMGYKFKFGWTDAKVFNALSAISKFNAIPQVFLMSGGKLQGIFVGGGYRKNAEIKRTIEHIWINGSGK